MIGRTFGRLTVAALSHRDERHRKHFVCRCTCGAEKTVQAGLLHSGNTRSCGCLARDAKAAQRLPNDTGPVTAILLGYKRHARDRGIEWNLSREAVDQLVRQPCHYCGVAGGNLKRTKNLRDGFAHNGIDRINSAAGYEDGNVVPCCGTCNRAKGAMTYAEFIGWACRLADHQRR